MEHKDYDPIVWGTFGSLFFSSVLQDLNTLDDFPVTRIGIAIMVVKYLMLLCTAFVTAWSRNKTAIGRKEG